VGGFLVILIRMVKIACVLADRNGAIKDGLYMCDGSPMVFIFPAEYVPSTSPERTVTPVIRPFADDACIS